jgi:serine/threonine-protein kinase PknK
VCEGASRITVNVVDTRCAKARSYEAERFMHPSSPMQPIVAGSLVASRYRLERRLGAGAQGAVWEVVDTLHDDARCTLQWSSGPDARREAQSRSRIEHPALPRAIDFGTAEGGDAWRVMERVEGVALSACDARTVAFGAAWVAGALAALHDAGIVHGDVKPANIVVRDTRACLVDLGLAGAFEGADGVAAGTLRYLAPEVLAGERGPAGDLFALGVTLAECLTGQHPFAVDPDDASELLRALSTRRHVRDEVVAALPSHLRGAVLWLLAHDPERRPPSARAWLARWSRDASVSTADGASLDGHGAPAGRAALVGRDRVRAAALDAAESALEGRGVGVVVVGPTGAGRRRVVDEVVRACRIAGAARGECPDVRSELPDELRRPTLVVMLDADEERVARAADAIGRLRRFDAARVPVALVATCTGTPSAQGLACVQLHALDRAEVRELLTALHGAPVPSSSVDAWIDATAGLPGRVVAIAHDLGPARLADAGRDELFLRAATLHRARLPEGLHPDEGRAAATLAVAGGSLPRAVLTAALGDAAGSALAGLSARGVTHARLGAVSLVVPVEAATLSDEARSLAARALAEALARTAPDDHALRARASLALGELTDAWDHAARAAADPSLPRGEAVRLLERCADAAPDRGVYALRLARTLLLAGEAPRALEVLAEAPRGPEARALELDALRRAGSREAAGALARELSDDASAPVRAVGRLALARDALDRGDPAAADATLVALGDDVPARLRPRALTVGARVAIARGDLTRAREQLERADTLALAAGDGAQRARARALLGTLAQRGGDHDAARRCYRDAWTLAWEAGDPHTAATCMASLGGAELACGALGESLRCLTRATRSLAALGRMPDLARALADAASLLAWIGDRGAARDAARRADEAAASVGDAVAQALARAIAADALDDAREAGAALITAARALSLAGDAHRADEARARAALRLVRAGALDDATAALADVASAAPTPALARVELALARRAPAADVDALLAAARAAVACDATAEHALWLLRVELASSRDRGDRAAAQRATATLRARVEGLAATLPSDLAAVFVEQHGPRDEAPVEAPAARDATRWRRLVAITHRLNDEPRLRALLELVMDAVVELTGASRGFLLLKGDDGELRIRTARNLGQRDLDGDDMAFSRSVAEQVARSGDALVTVDASADGRFNASSSVAAMQLRSILAVPLRVHGEVVGTVYVDDRFRAGAFDDDAVEVARTFAEAAAVAIHNARVRADLQRALRRAERLSEELERRVDAQRVELEAVRQTLATDATRGRYEGIVGRGAAMTRLLALVDRVAPTAMPVLLQGESGTGKELVARAIHANSARAARAFIAENCGAIPETLLESVLFGHVRGAFTGADRNRAGLFEVADGGTLFLDEVGEMSPAMQAKLLRVLQEGEVRPVGGERARKVDVRVIAATHRDLQDMVRKGTFREDLYYRIAVMVLPIPALRERREDIPALVAHMLQRNGRKELQIDRKAMARLVAAPWPGNVRQLENELQRAAVLSDGTIREDDLNATLPNADAASAHGREEGAQGALDLRHAVEDVEREMVERALREHGWNQSRAAKALGLSRFGLQKKLKRLGIPSRDPSARLRLVK